MGKVDKHGNVAYYMKDNGRMIYLMATEGYYGKMGVSMKGLLQKEDLMATANCDIQKV